MVVIRLARGGANGRPFFRVVVADKRYARDGRFLEKVGFFNPIAAAHEEKIRIDLSRVEYWIKNGAQPSVRVNTLLKQLRKASA